MSKSSRKSAQVVVKNRRKKAPVSKSEALPPLIQAPAIGKSRAKPSREALKAQKIALQTEMRERIWQTVALIPKGNVASYGQIAKLIGFPAHSRYVGRTLGNLPKRTKLPWYRVVNASLRISQRGGGEQRQRSLLEKEGITFIGERVAKHHRWDAGDI